MRAHRRAGRGVVFAIGVAMLGLAGTACEAREPGAGLIDGEVLDQKLAELLTRLGLPVPGQLRSS